MFGQSNGTKFIQIQREIGTISQGTLDIASYFTKFRSLWDELQTAYIGPTCSYGALPEFLDEINCIGSWLGWMSHIILSRATSSWSHQFHQLVKLIPCYNMMRDRGKPLQPQTFLVILSPSASTTSLAYPQYPTRQRSFNHKVRFEPKKPGQSMSCRYCKKKTVHTIKNIINCMVFLLISSLPKTRDQHHVFKLRVLLLPL